MHLNICALIRTPDLAQDLVRAARTQAVRINVARDPEELKNPLLLERFDILLIDEKMASLESWAEAHRVRTYIGKERPIFIAGLVERLDLKVMQHARELGLDAFLLKGNLALQLPRSLTALGVQLVARPDEPQWSPFVEPERALEEVIAWAASIAGPRSPTPPAQLAAAATIQVAPGADGAAATIQTASVPNVDPDGTLVVVHEPDAVNSRGSESSDLPDLIDYTLGKVRLQELIGKGATGRVYKGMHSSLDLEVAVKVLDPRLVAEDATQADRFIAEARLAARLAAGTAVRVIDCDRDRESGLYYLIMELIDGRSLADEIRIVSRMQEVRLAEIGFRVTTFLAALEHLGIVHRDIKPANILLTRDGEIRVTDLGCAMRVEALDPLASGRLKMPRPLTRSESIVGTPYYLSPEQIESPDLIDNRADLYSLGATLYHAAVGHPPHEGTCVNDILYAHLNFDPAPVAQHRPELSPDIAGLIMKMLARAPRDRGSSCLELNTQWRGAYHAALGRAVGASPTRRTHTQRLKVALGFSH